MTKEAYNYTSILNNFTENMRNKRLEIGMTQKELAKIIGVSAKTIQNYENRTTIPNSETMEAIATALGLSLERIIDEDETIKRKIQIAEYMDYMDTNGTFYRYIQGVDIAGLLYDKIEFKRRVDEGIDEEVLDEILKGKLNISKEEKIQFIFALFDSKIKEELKNAEKKIEENFENYSTGFRAIRMNDFSIIEKNDYFSEQNKDEEFYL